MTTSRTLVVACCSECFNLRRHDIISHHPRMNLIEVYANAFCVEAYIAKPAVLFIVVDQSLEFQMSKRKLAKVSKRDRTPKIAARTQRTKQAVVKGPKSDALRSVSEGAAESTAELREVSKQEAPISRPDAPVSNQEASITKEEANIIEDRAAALPDDFGRMLRDHDTRQHYTSIRFDFSSAAATVQAYQAKLLEIAQANMQFTLEITQRLATIRSPFEMFIVLAELTNKRIDMFRKYSEEMVELSTRPLIG